MFLQLGKAWLTPDHIVDHIAKASESMADYLIMVHTIARIKSHCCVDHATLAQRLMSSNPDIGR